MDNLRPWRAWNFWRIFAPCVLLLTGLIIAFYGLERLADRRVHEQAGQHLVRLHAEIISRELRSVESELRYLAEQALLRRFASGIADDNTAGSVESLTELQNEYVRFCGSKAIYDQIRFLDKSGMERIRVNYEQGQPRAVPAGDLQAKGTRYYFIQSLKLERGDIFVSPFDLNVEHGQIESPHKPVIRFATPVFDESERLAGVLVLNLLGQGLLEKLAVSASGFPGEAWLLNREGYYLRGPNRNEEWAFMFGGAARFGNRFPAAWRELEDSPLGSRHDESGLFTYRTIPGTERPIDGGPLPSDEPLEEKSGDSMLRIVSYVPNSIVFANANQLLSRLLLVLVPVTVGLAVMLGIVVRADLIRRDHERQLAESEARLRYLSQRVLTAQEDERRSFSRDLHDELGQLVTALTLDLEHARHSGDAQRREELLTRAQQESSMLLDRIHEISARVRPPMLDDLGLSDALRDLAGEFGARTGLDASLTLEFEDGDATPEIGATLFRIIQEALTNVSRHAEASSVTIEVARRDGRIDAAVADNGIGFDPQRRPLDRLGILGMRERAELLGGSFQIESSPGHGTRIRVSLPLRCGTLNGILDGNST
jgi:signal transduction histidine kinase